jgi:hypothetical protein
MATSRANELTRISELKGILQIIPVVLVVDLVPKTEPTMTATMAIVVNKLIGIMNLFF